MDPNAKNNDGDTPLHTACLKKRSEQILLLVRDERCNPNEKDSRGDTALHVACRLVYRGTYDASLSWYAYLTNSLFLSVVDHFNYTCVWSLATNSISRILNAEWRGG